MFKIDRTNKNMSHATTTEAAAVETISTQEIRQLLESKRPVEFWNVLTDEWFKGENIAGSRRVPLDKVGIDLSLRAKADQLAGVRRPPQRTCVYVIERHRSQALSDSPCGRFASLG